MAQSIANHKLSISSASERVYPKIWKLRLALAWTILAASLGSLFAVSWDIQWHSAVGRDRTLTAPHLFILGSLVIAGLTALLAVLIETAWARRNTLVAQNGTRFAGVFSSSLGAYLVGYGALDSAIAFPLDQYWHTLYGIDVSIWAPFHIMALVGLSVSCLGVIYMLAEGAQGAAQRGAVKAARAGYIGVIVACATLLGVLSILLPNALSTGYVSLGNLTFTVFPLMLGAFGMFIIRMASRALPWPAIATTVALVYVFLGLLNFPLVPQLMVFNLHLEQQSLLPGAPAIAIIGIEWQYWLLVAAILFDVASWLARRAGWSQQRTDRATLVVSAISLSLAAFLFISFLSSVQRHSSLSATSPLLIIVISLLLGLVGIYVGNWFGIGVGESMQQQKQEQNA